MKNIDERCTEPLWKEFSELWYHMKGHYPSCRNGTALEGYFFYRRGLVTGKVNWIPVAQLPEEHCGWYLAAMLPGNHDETDAEGIAFWRGLYGCTKVWYNWNESGHDWWEPSPHWPRSEKVTDRVTHWAELPRVPDL